MIEAWLQRSREPRFFAVSFSWRCGFLIAIVIFIFLAEAGKAQGETLPLYATKVASSNNEEDTVQTLAIDADGNAIVAGSFRSESVTVADTATLANQGPPGTSDVFVAHFKADGSLNWAANWGGNHDDVVVDVAMDPSGASAYVVGVFKSPKMSFSPVGSEANDDVLENIIYDADTLPTNVFIVKVSSTGKVLWRTQTGDKNIASVSVDSDSERVYVTGTFPSYLATRNDDDTWKALESSLPLGVVDDDVTDEGGSEETGPVEQAGGSPSTSIWAENPFHKEGTATPAPDDGYSTDMYVDYYSSVTGELVDGTVFTGDLDEIPTDLVLEAGTTTPFVTGFSESGRVRLAPNLVLTNTDSPLPGDHYGFVAKLDPTGKLVVWGQTLGLALGSNPLRLAVDSTRTTAPWTMLYVTGTFGSPEMMALMESTAGRIGSSLFPSLVRMNANTGEIVWVKGLPPPQQVGVDYTGAITVAGTFKASVSFSYDIPNLIARSANGDMYLARMDGHSQGEVVQVERFGGGSTGRYAVNDLTVDPAGNVYWAGNFTGGAIKFSDTMLSTPGSGNMDGFFGRVAHPLPGRTAAPQKVPVPTMAPTRRPTTPSPTHSPTTVEWATAQALLTKPPTKAPTRRPTRTPTSRPTPRPTMSPTAQSNIQAPSLPPTQRPTRMPTREPVPVRNTLSPTKAPVMPLSIDSLSSGTLPTLLDTSGSSAAVAGTNVDMVLTYAGSQTTILEFQRSLYQLFRPYATSYATFIPSVAALNRRRMAGSSPIPPASTLSLQELEYQASQTRDGRSYERSLGVNRCTDTKTAKFSLPFYIEAKNRAATAKILNLLEDMINGVSAMDSGRNIFDNTVLCSVSYSALSASPLTQADDSFAAPQMVPATSGVETMGADGAACQDEKGIQAFSLIMGIVLGLLGVMLSVGVFYVVQSRRLQRPARVTEPQSQPPRSFFTGFKGLTPNTRASLSATGSGAIASPEELTRQLKAEKERWRARHQTVLAAEQGRLKIEHEAALAHAVKEEADRLKLEHSEELAAVRRNVAQGKREALPFEKESWERERDRIIAAAITREKKKWQAEERMGTKEAGSDQTVADAVNAERRRLEEEHESRLAEAEARWRQEQETAVAAAVARAGSEAKRRQGKEEGGVDVATLLEKERKQWETQQAEALAAQKKSLKLRYATTLTEEMQKWEREKASLLASLSAASSGDLAGATTAAILTEREKLTKEHETALKAAMAAEKEKGRQEREAELFAQKNTLKQRYGQALMQEREKWRQEAQEAMEEARAAWEREHAQSLNVQRSILDPNHPAGIRAVIDVEREKWVAEHAASLAAALASEREVAKQEHSTALQASLAAQRKKMTEEHAKSLAQALSGAGVDSTCLVDARAQWETELDGERVRWQQEHEAAMLAQKNELKLRYATVLAQEKEKWMQGSSPPHAPSRPSR